MAQPRRIPIRFRAIDCPTIRFANREVLGVTAAEYALLRPLTRPTKIQAFLDAIPINREIGGETILSVREVLRQRRAHCIEGAFVAACALWIHGDPPRVMYMDCASSDSPHVVALFRRGRSWGAISKSRTEHLRYRDPVYRTLRELAMSYFHEYIDDDGRKTLRRYSLSFDLRRIDVRLWVTNLDPCQSTNDRLAALRQYPLISSRQARLLSRNE